MIAFANAGNILLHHKACMSMLSCVALFSNKMEGDRRLGKGKIVLEDAASRQTPTISHHIKLHNLLVAGLLAQFKREVFEIGRTKIEICVYHMPYDQGKHYLHIRVRGCQGELGMIIFEELYDEWKATFPLYCGTSAVVALVLLGIPEHVAKGLVEGGGLDSMTIDDLFAEWEAEEV